MSVHFGPLSDGQAFEQEREIAQLSRENEMIKNELSVLRAKEMQYEHGKDKYDKYAEEAEKMRSDAEISDAMSALQIAQERLHNETNEENRQILMHDVQKKKDKLKRASDHVNKYFKKNNECQDELSVANYKYSNLLQDLFFDAINQKKYDKIAAILNKISGRLYLGFGGLNKIGDIGASAIADALKDNKTITGNIFLNQQLIGDLGAIAIAKAFKTNKTITGFIDLRDNQIGDAGAIALADALKVNKKIGGIYLRGNKIGEETKKMLQAGDTRFKLYGSVGLPA